MKVNTVQAGDKLYIMNGKDPLRYVDLTNNKVVQYKQPKPKIKLKQKFWWLFPKKRKQVHVMQAILDHYYQKMADSMLENYIYGMKAPITIKDGEFKWPKTDGFKTIGTQPNLLNVLETTEARNICIWWDGTMRPMKGHMGACGWKFDGQIWYHL